MQRRRPRESGAGRTDNTVVAVGEDVATVNDRGRAGRVSIEQGRFNQRRGARSICLKSSQGVLGDDRTAKIEHVLIGAADQVNAVSGIVADLAIGDVKIDYPVRRIGFDAAAADRKSVV